MADGTSPTNIDIQLLSGMGGDATGIDGLALEVQSAIRQCTVMTRSIYTDEVRVMEKEDPEIADERYFVFRVADSGSVDDMFGRYLNWHERLSELPQHLRGMFRLSIDIRR